MMASGSRLRPAVLPLVCPACRGDLPAAANDLAFRCPRCGRAWEIDGGELAPANSAFVVPPASTPGAILYLPYWTFAVTARADPVGSIDPGSLRARDRAAGLRRAFVAAYAVHRPTYVGEWGRTYTRAEPEWEARHGGGPGAPGASLSSEDAGTVARHYVLGEIDRAADLSGLDVEVVLGRPELWMIPCLDLGSVIRCPWTRAELPATALDDLDEIRQAAELKEA